ncbi:MAG: ubiquitin fusion degradation protein UFD1-domain-containing protein [Linnemannia gamsii]|nr:MAG: ubiquitin fusion degradation protein UFD1-domain-containing protein [Linnemannia gamsii]
MPFAWSSTFTIGQPVESSKGDRIILPQPALESIIQAHASAPPPPPVLPDPNYDPTSWAQPQYHPYEHLNKPQELPSPLTFQIRNPANRLLTHGGVKEFSAADGQVHLPVWMMSSLALSPGDQVMIKYAALPKGTWAKFRPLSADYVEILDFRALLEARLRSNYTTLTRGEVLKVHQGTKEFGFVVEELKPEPGEAVCITDTDLEVDIEPLDTEMVDGTTQSARGVLNGHGSRGGTNLDNVLKIGVESQGHVAPKAYQRWTADIPIRKSGIKITVHVQEPGDLDVVVSTKHPVSLQDHIWANFDSVGPRVITIPAADQDYTTQQGSQIIHIALHGRESSGSASSGSSTSTAPASAGEVFYSIQVQYHDDQDSSSTPSSDPATIVDIPNKDAPGMRGLNSHESYCGDRTIQCQKCSQIVSLKDVQVHAQNHEYQRQNQATPQLCSNQNCVRGKGSTVNVLGLCQLCFGPYWIPTEDPKNQKLVQRLARKYHSQLMTGCGNNWCRNQYCATSRGRQMDATSAATEMMGILKEARVGAADGHKTWLCVDEGTTRRKVMAELLQEEVRGQYTIEWCVKALEAERTDLEAAAQWLHLQAPKVKKALA